MVEGRGPDSGKSQPPPLSRRVKPLQLQSRQRINALKLVVCISLIFCLQTVSYGESVSLYVLQLIKGSHGIYTHSNCKCYLPKSLPVLSNSAATGFLSLQGWPCYYNTGSNTKVGTIPRLPFGKTWLRTAHCCPLRTLVLPSCHLTYRWKAGPGHPQQPGSQRSRVHYLWRDDNNQGFLVYLSAIALIPDTPIGSGSWLWVQVRIVEFEPLPQESSTGLVKRTERTSANG